MSSRAKTKLVQYSEDFFESVRIVENLQLERNISEMFVTALSYLLASCHFFFEELVALDGSSTGLHGFGFLKYCSHHPSIADKCVENALRIWPSLRDAWIVSWLSRFV